MEYTKTVWKDLPDTSTPITADKLNNIEDGVEYLFEHGVGGGDTLPIGIILPFSDDTIPEGYMLCDGSAISRTTYATLFSVIGTTYGVGDGSTTFNLPNLKGRVTVGYDSTDSNFDTLGETGGEKAHTLTVNEMPSHSHDLTYVKSAITPLDTAGISGYNQNNTGTGTKTNAVENTGGGEAHNNLQPYIVINYIIKVSQTTSTQAQVVDGYSASTTDSYSCNYVNNVIKDVYSTDEVKTNKVWIDERPIYRKIISLEKNDLSSGLNSINHNISNLEDIITIYGTLKRTDNNVQNLIPWDTTNTDWKIFVSDISSTSFGLTLGSNSYLYLNRLNIVLEYTKSTDNTGGTSSGGNR